MDFAKKQMEKYGWAEGKGLGKKEDGMKTAIKPNLKFDNAGVGYHFGEQFTNNWWENLYNNASNNLDVNVVNDEVKVQLKKNESINISTKNHSFKTNKKHDKYGSFFVNSKNDDSSSNSADNTIVAAPSVLTDEQLLEICGGRTGHKAARHGLKLNGKLSRIEKQEKMLLKKLKNFSLADTSDTERKIKKLNKYKSKTESKLDLDSIKMDEIDCSNSPTSKKYKKNRNKRVSFSETVTEYYNPEVDTSSQSAESEDNNIDKQLPKIVVLPAKIKEENNEDNNNGEQRLASPPPESDVNGQDEGIEQDIEDNTVDDNSLDHRNFEEAQMSNLSKKQRQLLKEKHKLARSKATIRFLEGMNKKETNTDNMADTHDNCKCKRRKLWEEIAYKEDDEEETIEFSNNEKQCSKKNHNTKRKRRSDKKKLKKQMSQIINSLDKKCSI